MIDNGGEITNQVEHDFSDDTLDNIHTKHRDNYIVDNGLQLSGDNEYEEDYDHEQKNEENEDDEYNYEKVDPTSEDYKKCPDSLSACLAVCQPILKIRLLAFTLCERECWERCGSARV